ncbi:Gbp2p [Fusarium fujikuroi]|nr:Gbp2p [Fusarium fujikuroi]
MEPQLVLLPTNKLKRERSRSPRRRSRSPDRSHRRRSYSPRSRSGSRDEYRRNRDRSPMTSTGAPGGGQSAGYGGQAPHRSYEERAVAREQMMNNIRETSQQDRRVYVGNLSYDVKWHHLKDFMRQAGEVLFADVLLLPNGMSKGCGIVEYATREQAQAAVATLSNQNLMGRLVYVREDREAEPRFIGATGGNRFGGGAPGGPGFEPPASSVPPNPFTDFATAGTERGEIIYVRNLPWSTSNDDLVELFTTIGKVEQAEIQYEPSGRSRGTGVVRFDSAETAETAIAKFQGYQYGGRPLNLSFVKYLNQGGNDVMDTDPHGGLTQDQIM